MTNAKDAGILMKDAIDISSEEYRIYEFGDAKLVRIEQPLKLKVSPAGHRILDAKGMSHYIPKGWYHLSWKSRDGQPAFVA